MHSSEMIKRLKVIKKIPQFPRFPNILSGCYVYQRELAGMFRILYMHPTETVSNIEIAEILGMGKRRNILDNWIREYIEPYKLEVSWGVIEKEEHGVIVKSPMGKKVIANFDRINLFQLFLLKFLYRSGKIQKNEKYIKRYFKKTLNRDNIERIYFPIPGKKYRPYKCT